MEAQKNTVEKINGYAEQNPEKLVALSEERFKNIVEAAADRIVSTEGRMIVMLAGPSASGKTTTAHKLAKSIQARGTNCYVISLDDFYLNRSEVPGYAEGKPDYETVYALDLPLLRTSLSDLLQGKETELPIFDFMVGKRAEKGKTLQLLQQDTIIVEGLHALNPVITDALPQEALLKMYISVSSRIYKESGEVVLNKRHLRFMRRLVRDYLFRASSAQNTLELWENVRKGEDRYLFPYSHLADIRINSIHFYEPCLFAPLVKELLEKEPLSACFEEETTALLNALQNFTPINPNLVPKDSLLREFVGMDEKLK